MYKIILGPHSGVFGAAVTTLELSVTAIPPKQLHLFSEVSIKETKVYVGKYVADADIIGKRQQSSGIKSIVVHGDYTPKSLHADFAILTVKAEFYFSAFVKVRYIVNALRRNFSGQIYPANSMTINTLHTTPVLFNLFLQWYTLLTFSRNLYTPVHIKYGIRSNPNRLLYKKS